jgi:hypothetical protein
VKEAALGHPAELVPDADPVPRVEVTYRPQHEGGHGIRYEGGRGEGDDSGESDAEETEKLSVDRFTDGEHQDHDHDAEPGEAQHDEVPTQGQGPLASLAQLQERMDRCQYAGGHPDGDEQGQEAPQRPTEVLNLIHSPVVASE